MTRAHFPLREVLSLIDVSDLSHYPAITSRRIPFPSENSAQRLPHPFPENGPISASMVVAILRVLFEADYPPPP
jgi:hypothetical protein